MKEVPGWMQGTGNIKIFNRAEKKGEKELLKNKLQASPALPDGVAKVKPDDGVLVVVLEPNENPANTGSFFFSSLGSSVFFSGEMEGVVVKVKPLRENLLVSLLPSEVVAVVVVVAAEVVDGAATLTLGLLAVVLLKVNLNPTGKRKDRFRFTGSSDLAG